MNKKLSKIIFRSLKINDFFKLHRMFDSLDDKTKQYIDLYWLGLKRKKIKWFFAQFPLFLSTLRFFRELLFLLYPYVIFIFEVALLNNEIVSYGFLIIRERCGRKKFLAELGITVSDKFQGKGIGSEIIKRLIKRARAEKISEIYLTTRIDNTRARSFYKKFGFKEISIIKDGVEWLGKRYDMYKMLLFLNE